MTTFVERSIEVEVPVRTAYDQWTQFEEFPRFMSGVREVKQIGEALTHWVADIGGVKREWDAAILEQVPDEKVAWAATSGATNAGAVYFTAVGDDRTQVRLTLEFEPEGIIERIGDVFDIVDRQAVGDLDRFKTYIEQTREATGGWRGTVEDGEVRSSTGTGGTRMGETDTTNIGTAGSGSGPALSGAAAGAATGAAAGVGVGAAGSDESNAAVDDMPGDLVAVGPTGDTHSTLETEPGPARVDGPDDEDPGVGHSGDPVAVEPPDVGGGRHMADGEDPGVGHSGDPVAVEPRDVGGGRHEAAWTDEPGGRPETTEATTDPVGEDWSDDAGGTASRTTGMGGAIPARTDPDERP